MSSTHRDIVIVGGGGHGRVALDTCRALGRGVRGIVEPPGGPNDEMEDVPILGGDEVLADSAYLAACDFIVAIGDQDTRRRIALQILEARGALATLIHPSCVVSETARIGAGTVLCAGAIVNTHARIGRFCIINTGAIVEHDNVLEDGVQICPGAQLAGGVRLGEDVFVGTGASVLPGVRVGSRAVVGAGSAVIEDVPDGITVVGVPGRIAQAADGMIG